jgi:hypothetical protein
MTEVLKTLKGKARVFACGGAGINIAKKVEQFRDVEEVGRADLSVAYIDTSRSNLSGLSAQVIENYTYLLEGLDGSGKIRRENHESIRDNTRKILQKFPAQDVNIVISSAAGGSGSVIAPSIVAELLENDQQVIVIIVGATDSGVEIENVLKTLKSYEAISQKKERPVVASYFQNSKDSPRDKVDVAATQVILSIAIVFSRENRELDTRDLYNFLNYQRLTSYKPKLVGFTVNIGEIATQNTQDVISVALITTAGSDDSVVFTPEYKAVGFLPEAVSAELASCTPLTLLAHNDSFPAVARELEERLEDLEKMKKARIQVKSILSNNDIATDDGMVL